MGAFDHATDNLAMDVFVAIILILAACAFAGILFDKDDEW